MQRNKMSIKYKSDKTTSVRVIISLPNGKKLIYRGCKDVTLSAVYKGARK